MKKRAFTLIELLVVIVIIGILATIAIPQLNTYLDKARDAKRQHTIQTVKRIILFEENEEFGATQKYTMSSTKFFDHLLSVGYALDTSVGDYCYYIASTPYTNSEGYDDNEFIIVTWGERTSTINPGQAGPIFGGTPIAEENFTRLDDLTSSYDNPYDYEGWKDLMEPWLKCDADRTALSTAGGDGGGHNGLGSPHTTFNHGHTDMYNSRGYLTEAENQGISGYANQSWYTSQ